MAAWLGPTPGLSHVLVVLVAIWFLVYGVSGISQRPVPNIGWWLGVLALVIGILMLILLVPR